MVRPDWPRGTQSWPYLYGKTGSTLKGPSPKPCLYGRFNRQTDQGSDLHEKSKNTSFAVKLENRAETLFWKSAKCRNQGNSIPVIAGKAKKIKGDKLSKVTSPLVTSLDDRDSPILGQSGHPHYFKDLSILLWTTRRCHEQIVSWRGLQVS